MLYNLFRVALCLIILLLLLYHLALRSVQQHEAILHLNTSTHLRLLEDMKKPSSNATTTAVAQSKQDHPSQRAIKNFWTQADGKYVPGAVLMSQNRQFTLSMDVTGEMRIHHQQHEHAKSKLVFWTNNGFQWVGERWAEVTTEGDFTVFHKDDNGNGAVWTTALWSGCQRAVKDGDEAVVVIGERGELGIVHATADVVKGFGNDSVAASVWKDATVDIQPICEVFPGVRDEEEDADMGRLAVIMVGGLRGYKKTCHDMNSKIFEQWKGSGGVDIFFATLDEEVWHDKNASISWTTVEEDLRSCMGEKFKLLEHVPGQAVEFPDLEATGKCKTGEPLSPERILNMLYHVDRGRQLMMKYMIQHGIEYDYVLRMRPDHLVWGDAVPPFEPLDSSTLLYPMQYWDDPVWSRTHNGASQLTPSDQATFGRLLPMNIYLSLYGSYANIVKTQQMERAVDSPPCYQPLNPCPYDTIWPCFIEGVMGYWARLNGIKVKMDWRWKWNLLRQNGELAKGWHGAWNESQGSRLVNNAFE